MTGATPPPFLKPRLCHRHAEVLRTSSEDIEGDNERAPREVVVIPNCLVSTVRIETPNGHRSPAAKSALNGATGPIEGLVASAAGASAAAASVTPP
jgi:hypothetical protein